MYQKKYFHNSLLYLYNFFKIIYFYNIDIKHGNTILYSFITCR